MQKLPLALLLCALCLHVACGEEADPEVNNTTNNATNNANNTNNTNNKNNTNNTNNTTCTPTVDYYNAEVKPLMMRCTTCHSSGGIASASMMVLNKEDLGDQGSRDAIKAVATASSGDMSLLLVKAAGGAGHTGGAQIDASSDDFKKLEELVARIKTPVDCDAASPF